MKAAIYPGEGRSIVIEDLPVPQPGPNDLLISVDRCGICGTDLSMTKGGAWDYGRNTQLGHEYAGEIVEVGKDVDAFRVGERIAVLPSVACGNCHACHAHGNNVLCHVTGASTMVGFAELASVPASTATRLPSSHSFTDGALIEPLAISLYGVKLARINPGDAVLVLAAVRSHSTPSTGRGGWAPGVSSACRALRGAATCRSPWAPMHSCPMASRRSGRSGRPLGAPRRSCSNASAPKACWRRRSSMQRSLAGSSRWGSARRPIRSFPRSRPTNASPSSFAVGYSMKEFLYIAGQMDKGHVDPKAIITTEIALADLPTMMDRLRGPNDDTKVHVRCTGF